MADTKRADEVTAMDGLNRPQTHEGPGSSSKVVDIAFGEADRGFEFLETHGSVSYTPEEEAQVIKKIDRVLMPLMLISYIIQFMDKNTLTQASVYDLIPSLGLVGQQYSWCSSIFYFGYLFFQPLSTRLLTWIPLGRLVAVLSLLWAVVLFCTAGVSNFAGMMVVRFLLGVFEGGISPAYVLITGSWYKKDEIPLRITLWYCGNGFAIILQSFIGYGIGHITDTGIPTWKWFFIIFGIVGLVWAAVLWWFMPDSVISAKFLTEREKMIAVERLRDNRTGVSNETKFKWNQFWEALKDVKVWYGFFYALACIIPSTAVAAFGGLIIKGFGYGELETSLLNAPLGITQTIALVSAGFITYKFPNTRCLMQFVWNVPTVIGAVLVYSLPESNQVGRLISFYCVNFTNTSLPMMMALTTTNIAGQTKRATASTLLFIGYSVGFIVGPQFFLDSEAPTYQTGFKTMIITFAISCLAPWMYYAGVFWANKRRDAKMGSVEEQDTGFENEEFLDLTDKQQPRFRYSA